MCTIDWSALALWAQAIILAVGARIAYIQLKRFNDNERVKNTLSLVRDYNEISPYRTRDGVIHTMTISSALIELAAIGQDIPQWSKLRDDVLHGRATPGQGVERERMLDAVVMCLNYFSSAGTLDKRKLLDTDLFLDMFCKILGSAFDYGTSVSHAEGDRFRHTLRDFEELAKKAKARSAAFEQ